MSLVSIAGGATGTGTVTLLAPVTNTNRTLTLPDVTDTVAGIAATQTLTNKTLTSPTLTTPNVNSAQVDTVSGTAPLYFARAWVNFNGTGTVAIRASGNVSSITDLTTGRYQANFSTAMPDANFAAAAIVANTSGGKAVASAFIPATTSVIVEVSPGLGGSGLEDSATVAISVFR